jgi:hypothetical protein
MLQRCGSSDAMAAAAAALRTPAAAAAAAMPSRPSPGCTSPSLGCGDLGHLLVTGKRRGSEQCVQGQTWSGTPLPRPDRTCCGAALAVTATTISTRAAGRKRGARAGGMAPFRRLVFGRTDAGRQTGPPNERTRGVGEWTRSGEPPRATNWRGADAAVGCCRRRRQSRGYTSACVLCCPLHQALRCAFARTTLIARRNIGTDASAAEQHARRHVATAAAQPSLRWNTQHQLSRS